MEKTEVSTNFSLSSVHIEHVMVICESYQPCMSQYVFCETVSLFSREDRIYQSYFLIDILISHSFSPHGLYYTLRYKLGYISNLIDPVSVKISVKTSIKSIENEFFNKLYCTTSNGSAPIIGLLAPYYNCKIIKIQSLFFKEKKKVRKTFLVGYKMLLTEFQTKV